MQKLINNLRNWFFARWFTTKVISRYAYGSPCVIEYREELNPQFCYIAKSELGYVCEGGCMGYNYSDTICKHVVKYTTRQSVLNDCSMFKPIKIKRDLIPDTCP